MVVRPIVCKRLIGRAEELSFLAERRGEAGRSHGGMVLVKGEAGVGKSRLISEFAHSLVRTRWHVGFGRSLEFAQRPYGPIVEALSRLDRGFTELAPAASKRQQFEAIFGRLAAAASRSATVLIIEDVHWADVATLEFLAYLGTRIATLRILVLASLRPEEVHEEHPLYGHLAKLLSTPHALIALQSLDEMERRTFIDEAIGDLDVPADVRRNVARTADGNPFFTEELLKSAMEGTGSLPTTVRGAIMERLRPLTDSQRRVLTQAAVIGRRFEARTLMRTLSANPAQVEASLQRARALQLIEQEAAGGFRFRHALTREAIYQERLAVQLEPMHRTIAEVLERDEPQGSALESLAYHWWAAGDRERAAHYNEAAGDDAARLHAHADAVSFYTRAVESLPGDDVKRAGLLEKIAYRHLVLGANELAHDAFAAAAEIYDRAGDHEREAACRVQLALSSYRLGRPEPTAPLLAMLDRLKPDEYRTRSRVHLGIAWITASFYEPAVADAHVAAVDPRAVAEVPDIRLHVHNISAWTAMTTADVERFRVEFALWLEAANAVEQPGIVTSALFNGAFCCTILGLHDEARMHVERALVLAREERNLRGEANALGIAACTALHRGDLRAARAALRPLEALMMDDTVSFAHAAAWGSLVAAHTGDERLIETWFERLQEAVTPMAIALCGAGFAELLTRRGRSRDAAALLARRLPVGDLGRGMMLTLLAVGRYGAPGDVPSARRQLAALAALPRETPERHVLLLFDAYVAERDGDHVAARDLAAAAVPGFARLGFPLLEAAARETSGDRDGAFAIYERCGATYDAERLRPAPSVTTVEGTNAEVLSGREHEIALLVAAGKSNVEIGRALSISHKTVEKHLGRVYEKLGFSTRAQLGAYVFRAANVNSANAPSR